MCLDGILQIADGIDDNYSKDIVKQVLNRDKSYKNVCIIGGGDLKVAGMILQGYNVEKITICDIDPKITEIVKKVFRIPVETLKALDTGKISLSHEDGCVFLEKNQKNDTLFDAIIVDCTNNSYEDSLSTTLFSENFYRNVR